MTVCYLCGYDINGNYDPRNPAASTMDHVKPRCLGGKQAGNLRPAHRICNITKGNGYPVTEEIKAECREAFRGTKAFKKTLRVLPWQFANFCVGEHR